MLKYAAGQLKSNKLIKVMAALVLSVLAVIFSMSLYINSAVFNFIAPRYYNPNAKVDVRISATNGTNFISEDTLDNYSQYVEKITKTIDLYGLITQSDSSTIVSIRGVHSNNVYFDEDYEVVDGTMFFDVNECVLPVALAESLGVKVGDFIDIDSNKKAISTKVVGIYKGFTFLSAVETIFVSNRTASYFMYNSYEGSLCNTLNIQLNSTIKAEEFIELLKGSDGAFVMNIVLAKDSAKLQTALNMASIPTTACMIMLIFLVLVIVFALYYLDSLRQRKMVRVFRDTGASTGQIFSVFLGSHFLVGLIGGVIGAVLSCIVTFAISSFVGISVNIFAVVALGFLMLLVSNCLVSLASTAMSIRSKRSKSTSRARMAAVNYILLAVVAVCTIAFVLMGVYSRQLLALGGIKNFLAIIMFCLMLVTVYAAISLSYDMYRRIHIKMLSKSRSVGLWLASAGSLKSKQTKNFFVILTTLIVVMVTTTSVLYFLQNNVPKPIASHDDSVIYCGNIQDKSRDKIEEIFAGYDATIFWSGRTRINFVTDEKMETYVNIYDKGIIDNLCKFNNPLSSQQIEYFASDTIGIYYADSRQSILKEIVGTIKSIVTPNGNKEVPFLGHLKEASYAMTDILINRATADYLGISNNIAYIKLNDRSVDSVLADTKSELFGYGIVVEKQSVVTKKEAEINKPLGDMFNIINISIVILLMFALAFYTVLISNYQKDNFSKLKAVGMSNRSLFSSQISVILPLSILSAVVGLAVGQGVRYCCNTIFRFMAIGGIRVFSNFIFFALPFIAVGVGVLIYLLSHYMVIRKDRSLRTDLER